MRDAQDARIDGFPYLRVNRFLASYRQQLHSAPQWRQWLSALRTLDRHARAAEIANLPATARARLTTSFAALGTTLNAAVYRCGQRMTDADLANASRRAQLRARATVADDYRSAWRFFGLYPITALFVEHGVARLQRRTRRIFETPLRDLPVSGHLVRYLPPAGKSLSRAQVVDILRTSSRNPMSIPQPNRSQLTELFDTFAPIYEIDTLDHNDRIGAPFWGADAIPQIDTQHPVVYRLVSHARVHGRALLQLNYVIWFGARERTSAFDLLGGHLDGLTWRVTLAADGRPLMYDVMHNCGCYYMAFPSARLRLRAPQPGHLQEPVSVPAPAPPANGARMRLRLAHRTHYLEHIYRKRGDDSGVHYNLIAYDQLRSLPRADDSRRSLFGENSIVAGTERAERWLLWPMGVVAPGAMRQWGHHAIAFVGRRQFDDPGLIDRLFTTTAPNQPDGAN